MILCADDFGIAPDVDEAILDLARRGRISAVSCMVTASGGPCPIKQHMPVLNGKVDLGLHLNLVEGRPLSEQRQIPSLLGASGEFAGFKTLFIRSLLGRLNPGQVQAEISAQYKAFAEASGRQPDFVDSHMHVHQLHCIAQVLTSFRRTQGGSFYIRNSHQPFLRTLKQGIAPGKSLAISIPGLRFKRLLLAQGIPTNEDFSGVYQFRHCARYPQFLARFVESLPAPNGILMTHPGKSEPWRRAEYEALLAAPQDALRINRYRFS